jgi:penicillin-binding protein 1A
VNVGGEWYYEEYARGGGVSSLGGSSVSEGTTSASPGAPGGPAAPSGPRVPEDKSLMNSDGLPPNRPAQSPSDEKRSILDLFRN